MVRMGRLIAYMDHEAIAVAIDEAVAAELRSLRGRHKLSRAKLAELSGVAAKTIQRFENGERSPDMVQLTLLSRAFGISPRAFIDSALADVDIDPIVKEGPGVQAEA
jgi:transcriptional regulator with XRE-family HTH domain